MLASPILSALGGAALATGKKVGCKVARDLVEKHCPKRLKRKATSQTGKGREKACKGAPKREKKSQTRRKQQGKGFIYTSDTTPY